MIIDPVDIMGCLDPVTADCQAFADGFNIATPILIYITAVLAPIAVAIKIVNMVGSDG